MLALLLRSAVAALVLLEVGCGRIDYDPAAAAGDGGPDGGAAGSDGGVEGGAPPVDGGMDAGSQDAGLDAGGAADDGGPFPDGGTVADCPTGALFCDDFEEGFTRWTSASRATTLVSSPVRSGVQAFASPLDDAQGDLAVDLPTSLTTGSIHIRSFVWIPGGLGISSGQVLLELTELAGAPTPEKISLNLLPSSAVRIAVTTGAGSVDSATGVVPRDTWACLELAVQIGTSGTATASVNGVEVAATAPGDTIPPTGFGRAKAGASIGRPTVTGGPYAYFDDVVVDDAPIGCE